MSITIKLNLDIINKIDLSELNMFIKWNTSQLEYFNMDAGKEHYKLLAFLSLFIDKNIDIIDLGTNYGSSALALSYNNNKVITYDIFDNMPNDDITIKTKSNITLKIINCNDDIDNILKTDLILLDIDPHDGIQELEFFNKLIDNNYKGLLILDDIFKNKDMESFWNTISLPKIDITKYGHITGTGVVLFNDKYNFVLE
jgi:hypothetical protein